MNGVNYMCIYFFHVYLFSFQSYHKFVPEDKKDGLWLVLLDDQPESYDAAMSKWNEVSHQKYFDNKNYSIKHI